jgi:type I restriction enzyme M protein
MAKKKSKTKTKKVSLSGQFNKLENPKTTAQQLGTLIKSARDIMRKDKGLNGDLDRLPLLTWIMFLKFLDDRERLSEAEAAIGGKSYKAAIDAPYRWRDWAAQKDGISGDELLEFVNHEEAIRPDGKRGPGLIAYLRRLQSSKGDRRREVIAAVFNGVINRMISGYLLRDVINLVNGIHFDSTDEIHTLARLYESMLQEMRDAAGDSGEFYTPRPVIQFMVEIINPRLGEVVLDPACGTGGFLSEAFIHLERQCRTVQDRKVLQDRSIQGGEAKPLPYMLSQMNLLLHGLNAPAIEYGNSLAVKLTEIGNTEQVDVILTNPPFGGEEEAGIRNNFPADRQASETALLFLQLIMRKLRKQRQGCRAGRAAFIVPNTTLFFSGVAARLRADLIRDYGLHTVVRLPKGVFEPYTDIETNILFLDQNIADGRVLFYRLQPPENRKQYTKTQPLRLDELRECIQLIRSRSDDSLRAWFVDAGTLQSDGQSNLDQHNPKDSVGLTKSPGSICTELLNNASRMNKRIQEAERSLQQIQELNQGRPNWTPIRLRDVLSRRKDPIEIKNGQKYKRITIRVKGRGIVLRDELDGSKIGTKRQFAVEAGQFALSKIDARNGAFGVIPPECDGAVITGNFWTYDVNRKLLHDGLLHHFTQSAAFLAFCIRCSPGATNRRYLQEEKFLEQVIWVPEAIDAQDSLAAALDVIRGKVDLIESGTSLLGKSAGFLMGATLQQVFPAEITQEVADAIGTDS